MRDLSHLAVAWTKFSFQKRIACLRDLELQRLGTLSRGRQPAARNRDSGLWLSCNPARSECLEYSYKYEVWQLWIPLDALDGIKSEGGVGVVSTLSFQGDKKEWKYV
jgi:hypothetical protein